MGFTRLFPELLNAIAGHCGLEFSVMAYPRSILLSELLGDEFYRGRAFASKAKVLMPHFLFAQLFQRGRRSCCQKAAQTYGIYRPVRVLAVVELDRRQLLIGCHGRGHAGCCAIWNPVSWVFLRNLQSDA